MTIKKWPSKNCLRKNSKQLSKTSPMIYKRADNQPKSGNLHEEIEKLKREKAYLKLNFRAQKDSNCTDKFHKELQEHT